MRFASSAQGPYALSIASLGLAVVSSVFSKSPLYQQSFSFQELLHFLSTVTPEEWETDYGACYQGEPVTIANTVGALSSDYLEHIKDIKTWVTSGNV